MGEEDEFTEGFRTDGRTYGGDAENYDGVLYWRGITIFERQGHKLIVGNGFVWDAREEKLYGDPKNALGQFGGSEDCDEDVLVHYTSIRMATRRTDDDPDLLKNELWELQLNDSGFVDVLSTDWNQIVAEVTPWGTSICTSLRNSFSQSPLVMLNKPSAKSCFENWMIWGILKTKFVGFLEYEQ